MAGQPVQIDNRIMAGASIVPGNFLKIWNTIDDPMSENRIAFVKQMEPVFLIDPADLVVEMGGFKKTGWRFVSRMSLRSVRRTLFRPHAKMRRSK